MTFTIHKAQFRDLAQIAAISLSQRHIMGVVYSYGVVRSFMDDPNRHVYVARNARGQLVAYGVLLFRDGVAYTTATAVSDELRISGAATALVEVRDDLARRNGVYTMRGHILKGNDRSLGFRQQQGYEIVGEKISEHGDFWVVEKDLSPVEPEGPEEPAGDMDQEELPAPLS